MASRRLREALPVLTEGLQHTKAGKANRKIRRLTQALGTVRELDVTLRLIDELAERPAIPRAALAEVRALVIEEREQRRAVMLERLNHVDVAKLGRRLHDETLVEVVLDRERNPKIPDDHLVEAEVHMKGPNLHGREAAATYEAAADVLVDKLERQIERRRDKVVHEPRRRAQAAPAEPMPVERIEESLRATSEI